MVRFSEFYYANEKPGKLWNLWKQSALHTSIKASSDDFSLRLRWKKKPFHLILIDLKCSKKDVDIRRTRIRAWREHELTAKKKFVILFRKRFSALLCNAWVKWSFIQCCEYSQTSNVWNKRRLLIKSVRMNGSTLLSPFPKRI